MFSSVTELVVFISLCVISGILKMLCFEYLLCKDIYGCIYYSLTVKDEEKLCVFRDDKDCQFTFKYKLDADDYPIVHAQRTKGNYDLNILLLQDSIIHLL